MCYYECHRYDSCQCSKWGNFRRHCAIEYCTGEECFSKFIFEIIRWPGMCGTCRRIDQATSGELSCDFRTMRQPKRKGVSDVDIQMLEDEISNHEKGFRTIVESDLDLCAINNIDLKTVQGVFHRATPQHKLCSGSIFQCLCGKLFSKSRYLLRHISSHISPYVCLICEHPQQRNYERIEDCLAHIQKEHDLNLQAKGLLLAQNSFWKIESLEEQIRKLAAYATSIAKAPGDDECAVSVRLASDLQNVTLHAGAGMKEVEQEKYSSDGNLDPSGGFSRTPQGDLMSFQPLGENIPAQSSHSFIPNNQLTSSQSPYLVEAISIAADYPAPCPQPGSVQKNTTDDTHGQISNHRQMPLQSQLDVALETATIFCSFDKASRQAYKKLWDQAPPNSPAFATFLNLLGTHEELVLRGFACFDRYLNHQNMESLEEVYSFLHIAFAISQTKDVHTPVRRTRDEFHHDIITLRSCLRPEELRMEGEKGEFVYVETDIFDLIVHKIMEDEINHAISWIGRRTGGLFMTRMGSKLERLQKARNMLKAGAHNSCQVEFTDDDDDAYFIPKKLTSTYIALARTSTDERGGAGFPSFDNNDIGSPTTRPSPPNKPSWLDIVKGSIFLIILGFLQDIPESEKFFQYSTEAPYSFLCKPYPEPEACGCMELPGVQYFAANRNFSEFVKLVQDQFSNTMPEMGEQLMEVVSAGIFLLQNRLLRTLRHLENYVLGFVKLCYNSLLQIIRWPQIMSFLETTLNCSRIIAENVGESTLVSSCYESEKAWGEEEDQLACRYIQALFERLAAYAVGALDDVDQMNDDPVEERQQSPHPPHPSTSPPPPPPPLTITLSPTTTTTPPRDSSSPSCASSAGTMDTTDSSPWIEETPTTSTSMGARTCYPSSVSPLDLNAMEIDVETKGPSGSPSYSCYIPGCKKSYNRSQNLYRHVRERHELGNRNDVNSCNLCSYSPKRYNNLTRHRRLKHGIGRIPGSSPIARQTRTRQQHRS